MNFVKRLKAVREKRKISQKELAFLTDLKPSAISHFESGRRRPSFNNLISLADGLCINIDYLLSRTDEWKPRGL